MADTETWTSPAGVPCRLEAVDMAERQREFLASLDDEDAAMFEPWYADFPGQRPPQAYRLVAADGLVVDERTVFPVEPWSPYDAVSDVLVRDGWTPPPPTADELAQCEHGLSLALCAGPMHYPDDRRDW